MLNEITKKIFPVLLCTCLLCCNIACTSGSGEDEKNAEKMMLEINSLYSNKQYDKAMSMIDSLMKSYPGMIDIQHKALHTQTVIVEQQAINDSIDNDVAFAKAVNEGNLHKANLKYVKTDNMVEGYYVPKNVADDGLLTKTGILARVSDKGNLSVVSALFGGNNHTRLTVTADGFEASTIDVPKSNSRNYSFLENGIRVEMVTFETAECDSLCAFIANHSTSKIKLSFVGKRSHTIPLTENCIKDIVEVYNLYIAYKSMHTSEVERIKIMRRLQLARKQVKQTATNLQGNK